MSCSFLVVQIADIAKKESLQHILSLAPCLRGQLNNKHEGRKDGLLTHFLSQTAELRKPISPVAALEGVSAPSCQSCAHLAARASATRVHVGTSQELTRKEREGEREREVDALIRGRKRKVGKKLRQEQPKTSSAHTQHSEEKKRKKEPLQEKKLLETFLFIRRQTRRSDVKEGEQNKQKRRKRREEKEEKTTRLRGAR